MNWKILTVGKPALAYARAGRDEYLTRLKKIAPLELITIKAGDQARESAELLNRSEGCFRVVLDEHGLFLTSRALAAKLEQWQTNARDVAFLIGGANGHTRKLIEEADFLWSLSPLTLQHELALVVALEQIYRAHSIRAGHPYHRD